MSSAEDELNDRLTMVEKLGVADVIARCIESLLD